MYEAIAMYEVMFISSLISSHNRKPELTGIHILIQIGA